MRIMGYVTYAGQNWRDYVYLKKNSKCGHKNLCECKKLLLAERKIDRPFIETPIQDPQLIDGRLVKPNAMDEDILIRVGLLASTLISAELSTSPVIPTYMDKYTTSQIRMNKAFCHAYSGRFIRYQATLQPARHAVAWIEVSSPLIELISKEVHKKLSCGLSHKHTSMEYTWQASVQQD